MATTVFLLPVPLVLLVHLHILEYPHANRPEYDHSIFDPRVRSLRERTKSLEDICHFLVGRLEGNSKMILPSYPCLQPSDTVAFRTSLAKYLESLRHNSLYPTSKVLNGLGGKSNRKRDATESREVAWWWKDVVVRKSLLEECSGEKFERLLLSVSTHTLLHGIFPSTTALPDNARSLLRNQPVFYFDLLSRYKSIRHTWSHSASVVMEREGDLKSIQERLNPDDGTVTSKYQSLETDRLVNLANSKFQDLLWNQWRSREGRRALEFLTELSGFKSLDTAILPHPSEVGSTSHPADSRHTAAPPPPPLPIAAAHHPANLKKIRRPVFVSTKLKPKLRSEGQAAIPEATLPKTSRSFAKIALSDRLDAEIGTQQALADGLARVKRIGRELMSCMKARELKREDKVAVDRGLLLDLWQPDQKGHQSVNFDTQPTPELLSSLSLHTRGIEKTLDMRIDYIRELLPAYPPVPNLSAPRLAVVDTQPLNLETLHREPTKIPHAKPANASMNKSTVPSPPTPELSSPSLPVTSTPPAVKPRSTDIRRAVVSQTTRKQDPRQGSRVPRKSIRFSLATNRRLSLFANNDEDDEQDEIHRIVDGTHDESFEDPHAPVTPKVKGTPLRRIFTGTKGSTVKRPKQSYPMAFHEPAVALPSLVSPSSSFNDLLVDATDDDDDEDWMNGQTNGSAQFQEARAEEHLADGNGDDYLDEGPSMTLRDILLRADMTQFDLLDAEEHEHLDESFGWD